MQSYSDQNTDNPGIARVFNGPHSFQTTDEKLALIKRL